MEFIQNHSTVKYEVGDAHQVALYHIVLMHMLEVSVTGKLQKDRQKKINFIKNVKKETVLWLTKGLTYKTHLLIKVLLL